MATHQDNADAASIGEKQDGKMFETSLDHFPSHANGTVATIDGIDPTTLHNDEVITQAIQAIGFGKFQWQLTFSCGFGFLVDQMVLVSISLVTPQAAMEFGPRYATLLSASSYAGLLIGALFLGTLADNFGRRLVWQASIFGCSIMTTIAASSPNWAALNVFISLIGLFAGGNLAIDLTLLAEAIPQEWSFILSSLAGIWGFGNAVTGLIAWPLLVNFGCPSGSTPETCSRSDNMGWRYLYITLGGLCLVMSLIRAFVLRSLESPRWLVSCGKMEEAAEVINHISRMNKSDYHVTGDSFLQPEQAKADGEVRSWRANIVRASRLFSGAKQIRLMIGLIMIWALIGIAYPLYTIFLPYYLAAHGANFGETSNYITYRDWTVSSIVGIFGPVLSTILVSSRFFKSKRSMLLTGIICAAFSGAFTSARTAAENLAFSCMINFSLNALYAIVYSYTPQVLQVQNRGMGMGLLMAVGRTASLSAPFIATFADVTTSAPIWVACACFLAIGLIAMGLPADTRPYVSKKVQQSSV
ncbi:related to synaptic vesicle transporter SV2 (major facilitator superfamily) [Fusarium fujikuroi]|nr:synaptic vesicle transporter SV2 (major facilitator superfamily) [Fusarium fujikuroi]KLP15078.1 synaptic vesicle transporter SV2 (major facilitator superfamily) [Fusarium fujikuroi]SCN65904.1 related to synaptic vesicle transporter SV2 (major facilitator superfamily) [Fusarium fujikuroi]SCO02276.1 related to synaptic vesicle transporter SV2 (major facilitator superfamily) [Fusarium fujikuroi]SCO46765.1 related to synaptic vesicle transporter SV2 (major facilitator superfamily) [Fusarium fuji